MIELSAAASLHLKERDVSDEARDDHGRWTDGGGGDVTTSQISSGDLAARVMDATREPDGGASINVLTGDEKKIGDEGYMASFEHGSAEMPTSGVSEKAIGSYVERNMATLSQPGNFFGSWHGYDSETKTDMGKVYLDVSRYFPSRDEAMQFAKGNNQLAIMNLKTGVSEKVG